MGKAKDIERKNARIYYVEQLKTIEEIEQLIPVSRRTISEWITKYGWKTERDARMNSHKTQVERIRELIAIKSERAIAVERQIAKCTDKAELELLKDTSIALGDEVSKWNKTLENLDKSNQISLSAYIDIMDSIFKCLQKEAPELYLKTLDFQEKHLQEISLKYG